MAIEKNGLRQISFEIPMLIPRVLTPNRSRELHWGTVAQAKTELQEIVLLYARDAKVLYQRRTGKEWEPLETAAIYYTFHVKNWSHVRDDDNVIASCKHLVDMLQLDHAGIIVNDSGLVTGQISWVKDDLAPQTDIIVTEIKVVDD